MYGVCDNNGIGVSNKVCLEPLPGHIKRIRSLRRSFVTDVVCVSLVLSIFTALTT
jgi:hypothetical protein